MHAGQANQQKREAIANDPPRSILFRTLSPCSAAFSALAGLLTQYLGTADFRTRASALLSTAQAPTWVLWSAPALSAC